MCTVIRVLPPLARSPVRFGSTVCAGLRKLSPAQPEFPLAARTPAVFDGPRRVAGAPKIASDPNQMARVRKLTRPSIPMAAKSRQQPHTEQLDQGLVIHGLLGLHTQDSARGSFSGVRFLPPASRNPSGHQFQTKARAKKRSGSRA